MFVNLATLIIYDANQHEKSLIKGGQFTPAKDGHFTSAEWSF